MKNLSLTLCLAGALFAGCSSIEYEDPDKVETLTIDYGSTDLQTFAQSMADSLVASPGLSYMQHPGNGDDLRIVAYIGDLQNKTHEHIDMEGITDSIRTALVKSGKFRFVVADQGQQEIEDQVRFQQGSGRVDPALAKAFGAQLGADAILFGRLMAIDKHTGRTIEGGFYKRDDIYYKLTMEMVNIETAEVIWIEEKEIRKFGKTGLFG